MDIHIILYINYALIFISLCHFHLFISTLYVLRYIQKKCILFPLDLRALVYSHD